MNLILDGNTSMIDAAAKIKYENGLLLYLNNNPPAGSKNWSGETSLWHVANIGKNLYQREMLI